MPALLHSTTSPQPLSPALLRRSGYAKAKGEGAGGIAVNLRVVLLMGRSEKFPLRLKLIFVHNYFMF